MISVYKEIHSAVKNLPKDEKKSIERIVKRLHILSTMIGRIGIAFTADSNNSVASKRKIFIWMICKIVTFK